MKLESPELYRHFYCQIMKTKADRNAFLNNSIPALKKSRIKDAFSAFYTFSFCSSRRMCLEYRKSKLTMKRQHRFKITPMYGRKNTFWRRK